MDTADRQSLPPASATPPSTLPVRIILWTGASVRLEVKLPLPLYPPIGRDGDPYVVPPAIIRFQGDLFAVDEDLANTGDAYVGYQQARPGNPSFALLDLDAGRVG